MIRTINKITRFVARFLVFAFTGVAFLSALLIALTQVDSVRRWGVAKAMVALNGSLQGRVEVGSVTGNLITGLELHDVRVVADSTTVITAPDIELRYQLSPIFKEKKIKAVVILHEPVINLIRNAKDSVWNFARITRPTPITADTTRKTPFPYTIDISALEIVDATVAFYDLTQKKQFDTVARSINYSYLDLTRFNLSAQVHIEPTTQSMAIQNLYFLLPQPDIRVIDLSGNLSLDTTGATVEGLHLETDRSLLNITARLDSLNVFASTMSGPDGWHNYPVKLDLEGTRVSTLELRRFLPDLNFMNGTPSITLVAEGTFGNITINKLLLGLTTSKLAIAGKLKNLDHPDSLYIDARLTNSRVTYDDIPLYLPGLHIPDLRYLGLVELASGAFVGYPQNFTTAVDARTAIGSVRGGARLDFRGSIPKYDADLALVHVNAGPVLRDKNYTSDFNGHVVTSGIGVRPVDVNAKFLLVSESSTVAGRSYRKLITNGSVQDNGFIMVDTLLAAWGPKAGIDEKGILASAPANVDEFMRTNLKSIVERRPVPTQGERELMANNPSIGLGGWLDIRNSKTPRYSVAAHGHRFALADVLPGQSQTRFTFSTRVSGSSFDPDQMQGVADLSVEDAELSGGRKFTPFNAHVKLARPTPTERNLELLSDLVNIHLTGAWDFKTVIAGVADGVSGLVDYISRKTSHKVENLLMYENKPVGDRVNATYDLTIMNLAPLEIFLNGARLAAQGELHGDISGNSQLFSISATGALQNFFYQQGADSLRLTAMQLQIDLRNIAPGRIDYITSADVSIRTDSTASYNGTIFNAPRFSASLDGGQFRVRGATAINDQISLALDGGINTTDPEGYRLRMDTVIVALANGVQWRNVGTVQALIGTGDVHIDTLAMQRNNAEIVSVSGGLSGDNLKDIHVSVNQGSIKDLAGFFKGTSSYATFAQAGGRLRDLEVNVNGTLQQPVAQVRVMIDSMNYAGNYIGNLVLNAAYSNMNLTGGVKIADIRLPSGDTSRLNADVRINSFPLDLALTSHKDWILPGKPVDIQAITDSLPLAIAAPFLPGVQVKGGTANMKFSVVGDYPKMNYTGMGTLKNVKALIEGNNILYYANAKLTFKDQILAIEEMAIRNDPRDLVDGRATVTGHINFDGFTPTNLDLTVKTPQLLVLSDATEAVNEALYGDLVISSETLRLSGPLDAPTMTGGVAIVNGSLQMQEQVAAENSTAAVNYVDYATWLRQLDSANPYGPPLPDELANQIDTTHKADSAAKPGSLLAENARVQNQLQKIEGHVYAPELSFTDRLMLEDLRVTIPGRLFFTLNRSAIEQLRAELESPAGIIINKGADGVMKLDGSINLQQGSRYIFIKSFEATGNLVFKGDLDETQIGINGIYNGRTVRSDGQSIQEYQVMLALSGTLKRPDIRLDYTVDGQPPSRPDQDTRNRNAISLLVFGRTSDELGSGLLGALNQSVVGATASAFASRIITAILGGGNTYLDVDFTGVDITGQRRDFSRTKLTVIQQFKRVLLRYG
ncbi:MAG: translocation/assembly module TamB domain-containing protein, partial [Candidatus Kapaibacterium sp.]